MGKDVNSYAKRVKVVADCCSVGLLSDRISPVVAANRIYRHILRFCLAAVRKTGKFEIAHYPGQANYN
jgi:hypothetical protein